MGGSSAVHFPAGLDVSLLNQRAGSAGRPSTPGDGRALEGDSDSIERRPLAAPPPPPPAAAA
eukprot:SAG11_NODE_5928_length_1431_cov_2.343093_1_plen_61_part_10